MSQIAAMASTSGKIWTLPRPVVNNRTVTAHIGGIGDYTPDPNIHIVRNARVSPGVYDLTFVDLDPQSNNFHNLDNTWLEACRRGITSALPHALWLEQNQATAIPADYWPYYVFLFPQTQAVWVTSSGSNLHARHGKPRLGSLALTFNGSLWHISWLPHDNCCERKVIGVDAVRR